MAAASFSAVYKWPLHATSEFMLIGVLTGPTSYPNTGGTVGIPLPASLFNLNAFADTSGAQLQVAPALGPIFPLSTGTATYWGFIDATTGNLRLIVTATGAEVANTIDVSAARILLMVLGR